MKRPTCLSWNFSLRGRLPVQQISTERIELILENRGQGMPSLCSPETLLQPASTSQKEVYTIIRSFDFCKCCQGNTPQSGGQQVYNCSPTGLYILPYFKSCCLRVSFPISLKVGAKIPPSETMTGFDTTSKTGTYQE